jgi:hypothetical protein
VLVASDGRSRRVSAPVRRDDLTFTGDGWTFKAAQDGLFGKERGEATTKLSGSHERHLLAFAGRAARARRVRRFSVRARSPCPVHPRVRPR